MKKSPAVDEIYADDDGHWVLLKKGYHIDGCHGWREDTRKALNQRIKDAEPCHCEDCA